MNFFKHHIGDYDQATRHLTFVEDAAYSRMIRKYYAEERPLPADIKRIQRLIGARTKEELQAVESVLEEFFVLQDDGWHQVRCDGEIQVAQEKASKNRSVGKLGGRPRKTETNPVQKNNHDGYYPETQTVSENNPSQTPVTSNQNKDDDTGESNSAGVASSGPRIGEICILLRSKGINTSPAALAAHSWPTEKGSTNDLIETAVLIAKQNKPNSPISVNYLRPIMDELLHPTKGKANGAAPSGPMPKDWL
jgi:uncharacterized protein YdaU (DUF1376 family)